MYFKCVNFLGYRSHGGRAWAGWGWGVIAAEQPEESRDGAQTRQGSRQVHSREPEPECEKLLSQLGIKQGFKKQTHGAGPKSEILQQSGGCFA